MSDDSINPTLFNWIVKAGTAIITFMTGIIVWMHRKLHSIDKTLAVNEEADKNRDIILNEIRDSVTKIKDGFEDIYKKYNVVIEKNKELSGMVKEQNEIMGKHVKVRNIR